MRATPFTRSPCPLAEKPPAWGQETLSPLGGEAAIPGHLQRLPGFLPEKHRMLLFPVSKRRAQKMTTQGPASSPSPRPVLPRMELQSRAKPITHKPTEQTQLSPEPQSDPYL